eukprot:TRINITY_DN31041_c0_g1_i1.p1 TRINITY_DN31041_c0_g1~~TRINITY_DN31041_c0_g1_i1.p1  ORF type:complete len:722 (+),score=61.44 TRINITY_DN31041_c0_g1_i1:38-2203(+)
MAQFKLSLHSVHGSSAQHASPLSIKELGVSGSTAERVSLLAETLSAVSKLHHSCDDCVQVSFTVGGLYALDAHDAACFWFPLASSTIVHHESGHKGPLAQQNAAGLLAYYEPIAPQTFSWGNMKRIFDAHQPGARDHVWIFVVTSAKGDHALNTLAAQSSVLQMTMEELGAHGAIRGDCVGLRSASVALGEGEFASVQLVQRDVPNPSSEVAGYPQSRTSSEARPRKARDERATANSSTALAAKVFKADTSDARFLEEASYLIAVRGHPNVARFFGMFCLMHGDNEPPWVLMTEAHGNGSLHDHIESSGCFPISRSLRCIEGLLQALVHIHSLDLIHRDVKSKNVLLNAQDRAVLIDFGLTVHTSQAVKLAHKCGTPGSIAPEFLRTCECVAKGDVFGAGIAFYEALSGIKPLDCGGKSPTLRANAKAKIPYDLECFTCNRAHITGLLRMMLDASPRRRHSSLVALEAVSKLRAEYEPFEVRHVHSAEVHDGSSLPPGVQSAPEARNQTPVGQQERRRRLPVPEDHNGASRPEEGPQTLAATVEPPNAQRQGAVRQSPRQAAWMHGQTRVAEQPPNSTEHVNSDRQKDVPSAPRTEAPVMNLLREYRRKLSLKDGNALSITRAQLSNHNSTNASASSSSSLSRYRPSSSSQSDPLASYVARTSNVFRSNSGGHGRDEYLASHSSFQIDDAEMSDRASVVSYMSSELSFGSDLMEEWIEAVS